MCKLNKFLVFKNLLYYFKSIKKIEILFFNYTYFTNQTIKFKL